MNKAKKIRSKQLPENTSDLLLALNSEFYGGEMADADAFRVLPLVLEYVVRLEDALHTALCIIENDAKKPVSPEEKTSTKLRWVEELVKESGIDREKMYV